MKSALTLFAALLLVPLAALRAAELTLTSPRDYQVVQRCTPMKGMLKLDGGLSEEVAGDAIVETRLV
ncbi:MAG: hypothetical protein WCF18_18840, partial [Chthoniobacteraceae bacterium]